MINYIGWTETGMKCEIICSCTNIAGDMKNESKGEDENEIIIIMMNLIKMEFP